MSQVIVPTIGRKIWLWPSGAERKRYELAVAAGNRHPSSQPLDASICRTHTDHCITVTAADGSGNVAAHVSVPLIQPGDPWDEFEGKHCQWMPFQVTAASKPEPQPAAPPADCAPTAYRELESHKINAANEQLRIEVMDGPGAGGAHHHYRITGFNTATNASDPFIERHGAPAEHATVLFQCGPIGEVGVNGVTHEALLAILIDRLQSFQCGAFANDYNAIALAHLRSAQGTLLDRTRERMARGVEGTHTV